jgi:hypothetical protein
MNPRSYGYFNRTQSLATVHLRPERHLPPSLTLPSSSELAQRLFGLEDSGRWFHMSHDSVLIKLQGRQARTVIYFHHYSHYQETETLLGDVSTDATDHMPNLLLFSNPMHETSHREIQRASETLG